jgi:hypothetical protein
VGFFPDEWTWAGAFGGSIDLNRSPRLVFRIAPDATLTNFSGVQVKEQFALSVGLVYRMGRAFGSQPTKKASSDKHRPWWRP